MTDPALRPHTLPTLTTQLVATLAQWLAKWPTQCHLRKVADLAQALTHHTAAENGVAGQFETGLATCRWIWLLHFLIQQPDFQARGRHEVQLRLAARPPTFADLAQLPVTRLLVAAAIHYATPLWLQTHAGLASLSIFPDSTTTPPLIAAWQELLHLHPDHWNRPEPSATPNRQLAFAYEVTVVKDQVRLAMVLQRYRFHSQVTSTLAPGSIHEQWVMLEPIEQV